MMLIPLARRLIGARNARAIRLLMIDKDSLREPRPGAPVDHVDHPEWWHALDGVATEWEVSEGVAGLIRALQPEYVIETGTHAAQTTVEIGKALRKNGHGFLVSLEIDPALAAHARELCRGLPVEVRTGSSLDFIPEREIDFAWFDTEVEIRADEFRLYYPRMRDGAVVGFHDTAPAREVRPLVDELEAAGMLKVLHFLTPRGFTLGVVRKQ